MFECSSDSEFKVTQISCNISLIYCKSRTKENIQRKYFSKQLHKVTVNRLNSIYSRFKKRKQRERKGHHAGEECRVWTGMCLVYSPTVNLASTRRNPEDHVMHSSLNVGGH